MASSFTLQASTQEMSSKHSSSSRSRSSSACAWAGLPWRIRLLVAAFTAISKAACRYNGFRRLVLFLSHLINKSASTKPENGVVSSDVTIDASRDLWFRIYTPSSSPSFSITTALPLIIYFHGGGFVFGSPHSFLFHDFCTELSSHLKAIVVSVNYRLTPENKYPSQYVDAFDVLKFIDAKNFRVLPPSTDFRQCFLVGDSAGGNIAHHMAVRAGSYKFRKLNVIGLIAIQPFFGGEERTESEIRLMRGPTLDVTDTDLVWRLFLPLGHDRNHKAVNVSGQSTGNIAAVKFPATVIFIGGYDPLQDWQRRYYEWLKAAGKDVKIVEYRNAIHGFYSVKELLQHSNLMTDMREFTKNQIARTMEG